VAGSDESTALLRREGEYWTIAHAGHLIRIRHSKGLGYLERLLREPGRRFLASELSGPPPRPRRAAAVSDRERVAVTKAIRSAIRRVAQYDQVLGDLLEQSVRTGAACRYVPVAGGPRTWEA
jgi:hypothetical protein